MGENKLPCVLLETKQDTLQLQRVVTTITWGAGHGLHDAVSKEWAVKQRNSEEDTQLISPC